MTGLFIAGIAGALGGALVSLLVRGDHRKALRIAVTVVAVLVFAKLGDYYIAKPYEAAKGLEEIPAFVALREHEPAKYAEVRAEVLSALRAGDTSEDVQGRVRRHLAPIVSKYIPRASDEALRAYIAVTVEEIQQISAKNPEDGVKFLFPQPGDSLDVAKYLDQDTQKRDLSALAALIRTGAKAPPRAQNEARATALLTDAVLRLRHAYGNAAVAQLSMARAPGVDPKRVCQMTADLYGYILSLPPEDSALVLRSMLAGA